MKFWKTLLNPSQQPPAYFHYLKAAKAQQMLPHYIKLFMYIIRIIIINQRRN